MKRNHDKEMHIYNVLVLNLSLADLLMGIYLITVSLVIHHKINKDLYFSEPMLCDTLGVVHFVSGQVSITVLAIISYYRLFSILFPYKQQHIRVVVVLATTSWLIWITMALLPVIPCEPFLTIFTYGVHKNQTYADDNVIYFASQINLFESLKQATVNDTTVLAVLNATTSYSSTKVLRKAMGSFGLLNTATDDVALFGYYNFQYTCSMSIITDETNLTFLNFFNLAIISYNLLASISVLIAYFLISVNVSGYQNIIFNMLKCKKREDDPLNKLREPENQRLFRRISIVVATDLLCWLPICITSLLFWTSDELFSSPVQSSIDFQTILIFVMSINSICNPYIYSYMFWKNFFRRIKHLVHAICSCETESPCT